MCVVSPQQARRVMSMYEWRMHVPPPSGPTTRRHQNLMQDYHKVIHWQLVPCEFISELYIGPDSKVLGSKNMGKLKNDEIWT